MSTVTQKIERLPVFVIAKNEIEAARLAAAKFARRALGPDGRNTSLLHHTTEKPLYRCDLSADGKIIVTKV